MNPKADRLDFMKKNHVLVLLSLLLITSNRLFCQTLSENSEISLLTVSPGKELWSFAGHSAIRIKDPANGIDANFNYGVFNFQTESFYFNFLRGTLPYQLGAYNFRDEMPYWIKDHRIVTEQVLNLSLAQKQKAFDFLINNFLPENREYRYKFFYDNCSTRIRDVFEFSCGDSLKFSQTLNADNSFRDWIDLYNRNNENYWAEFGMDILAGLPSDEKTNANRAMFIPDNLMNAFDSAQISKNGKLTRFVSRKFDHNDDKLEHSHFPIQPFLFFSIVFLALAYVTFLEYQKKKWYVLIDKVLFGVTGLLGWFMLGLWFLTDHEVMNQNFNMLWAFAPVFPAVFFLNRNVGTQKWLKYIFMTQVILALILIIGFPILPQSFHTAIIPIGGLVLLRSYLIWKRKG